MFYIFLKNYKLFLSVILGLGQLLVAGRTPFGCDHRRRVGPAQLWRLQLRGGGSQADRGRVQVRIGEIARFIAWYSIQCIIIITHYLCRNNQLAISTEISTSLYLTRLRWMRLPASKYNNYYQSQSVMRIRINYPEILNTDPDPRKKFICKKVSQKIQVFQTNSNLAMRK